MKIRIQLIAEERYGRFKEFEAEYRDIEEALRIFDGLKWIIDRK